MLESKINKRGLSSVVTTLIIILLVLVAVAIVWVVIRNVILGGTEEIGLGKFTTDLEIKNVVVGDDVNVNVKRNPGEGELTGVKFIFYDGINTEVVEKDISLEELEEKKFVFLSEDFIELNISNLEKVSIAGIFKSESGKESVGNIADSYQVGEGSGGGNGEPCVPGTCESLGKECGDDGCGGNCLPGCGAGWYCVSEICVEEAEQTCTELGGICCSSGETCQGGSFQLSSNCGSLCCVGGICESLSSLISWWKFEDNADDSEGDNHGTLNGNPVWVEGIVGRALEFDGDGDYVEIGADESLNLSTEYTISMWVKPNEVKSATFYGGNYEPQFSLTTGSEGRLSGIAYHARSGAWSQYDIYVNSVITADTWQYLTFTVSGGDLALYYNGELRNSGTVGVDTSSGHSTSAIGYSGMSWSLQYFNGTIDEVRIYNRSLSAEEVNALYAL